jgi:hypothetical protein
MVLVWAAGAVSQAKSSVSAGEGIIHLPALWRDAAVCSPVRDVAYGSLAPESVPTDRPAAAHPDLNLMRRGYALTSAHAGLVDIGGSADPLAPQLWGLFSDSRVPGFSAAYRVYGWDWHCNCRGPLIATPGVTLLSMATLPGELLHLPRSGYHIGSGYGALVLYATRNQLTIKYTREDNVIEGYTLHLLDLCVAPQLLTLYRTLDAQGRHRLPALHPGQVLGRASGTQVKVAIRDSGSFLDPRSRKDWWRGR